MGCCKDKGIDPLWCERRAIGKWHCKEAQDVLAEVEILWKTGELVKDEENDQRR